MADAHYPVKETATQTPTTKSARDGSQRYYTIGYTLNGVQVNPIPQLTIKDGWLEQPGFLSELPVIITAERGKLIIELEHQI